MDSMKRVINIERDTPGTKSSFPAPGPSVYVNNQSLQRLQQRVALISILVPTGGTVVAVATIPFLGISGTAIGLLVMFYSLTMTGIIVGFHRYFSHQSFDTHRPIQVILAILGSMAVQGPLVNWVATHRRHHKYSDSPLDAHSPHWQEEKSLSGWQGWWHSHIGWMLTSKMTNTTLFAKDILRDPLMAQVNRWYFGWVLLGLMLPALLGGLLTMSLVGAWQGLLWGGLVRIFLVHHVCWAISSVSHNYGARPFETDDNSTNNLWLAIPSFGGTWHNNHHAFPASPITGLMWWQVDIGGYIIRVLAIFGLAWKLRVPSRKFIENKHS